MRTIVLVVTGLMCAALAFAFPGHQESNSNSTYRDATWRRTANGWQRVAPTPAEQSFTWLDIAGQTHPVTVAVLEASLCGLALLSAERKTPIKKLCKRGLSDGTGEEMMDYRVALTQCDGLMARAAAASRLLRRLGGLVRREVVERELFLY